MEKHRNICAVTVLVVFLHFLDYVSSSQLLSGERVFYLSPRSVWHGTVMSKQLRDGNLPLCADTETWNVAEANQVCYDLGFQKGAMLYGSSPQTMGVDESVRCAFLEEAGAFCQENAHPCSRTAWVSCQFPGFVGCYAFNDEWMAMLSYDMIESEETNAMMTNERCLSLCRAGGTFLYAGVKSGTHCYCGMDIPLIGEAETDSCRQPCPGDERQACGGFGHTAIYETQLGACGGTYESKDSFLYISSPGFPGNYSTPTQCKWLFNVPFFSSATVKIIGMDFSDTELLSLAMLDVFTAHQPPTEIWRRNEDSFVRRGNWSFNVTGENKISTAVAMIFNATGNSHGDKQFLLRINVNSEPELVQYTTEPNTDLPRSPTTIINEDSTPARKTPGHQSKKLNGWVFAILVAAVLLVCVSVVVGYFYRQSRVRLHGNHIFRQSQLRDEAGVYGDSVHLQPDIDKDMNGDYNGHDESIDVTTVINTISPSSVPHGRVMNNI